MGRFDSRTVLVTGGTRGIGRACVEQFAREGAGVILCSRNADEAQRVAEEIGGAVRGYACDVAHASSVRELFERVNADFGPVAILVNNAGITRDGLLPRMKDEHWEDVLRADLTGVFHTCRAASRDMLRRRYGRIINISSVVALHGQAGQTNYAAAKAGIIGFSKAYAREVASRNITVNVVAPGFIETAMTSGMTEDAVKQATAAIPLGRSGTPQDVAAAVAFLASEEAAYITGAVLSVDGGLGM